ncbi:MAG: hypothetical protein AAGF59_11490 [Pseudomonadota bacterium]
MMRSLTLTISNALGQWPAEPLRRILHAGVLVCGLAVIPANAGDVEIVAVTASETTPGSWRFNVTLRHGDTGWDHYADRWEVRAPDGSELGVRVLAHPHVEEQPFTRSLGGVAIPDGVSHVLIRARDSVHGYSAQEYRVELK